VLGAGAWDGLSTFGGTGRRPILGGQHPPGEVICVRRAKREEDAAMQRNANQRLNIRPMRL
jgi:hypothetical protein